MTLLTYTLSSIGWSLAGLLIGVWLGTAISANRAYTRAVDEGEPMSDQPAERVPRWKWMRITGIRVLGAIVVVLGIATAVQGYMQAESTDRTNACLKAYADGFDDALEARTIATADAQQALDELITAVAEAAAASSIEGRAQVAVALRTYLGRRAEAKATQRDNPFPDPPRDLCKDA